MTMIASLIASLLLATTAALRPPPVRATSSFAPSMTSQNPQSRRALLLGALGTAVVVGNAKQVNAQDGNLKMDDDLSMPTGGAEPVSIGVITVGDGATKVKISGTASRIKEIKALGGNATTKEKKELKRLQQEEMCDLLGRGC